MSSTSTATSKLRGPVRGMVTRAHSEFETKYKAEEVDLTALESAFRRLENHMDKLTILDGKIEDELTESNASETEFTAEYEKVTEYRDLFTEAEVKFKKMMKNSDGASGSASHHSNHTVSGDGEKRTKYRLPKLEWNKFSGDPREWLAFWSQFKVIHEDPVMKAEEKFQYLIQATVENSEAWSVVKSFPPTQNNYDKAVEYLKSRFGNDEFLVEIYVRDLLRHVLNNAENKERTSIAVLYDNLETKLRALETLGVTRDKYAAMLYPLVESSLPEDILKTWQRLQSQLPDGTQKVDKLTKLMGFLKVEVGSEIRVKVAREGFSTPSPQSTQNKPSGSRKGKKEETPTAFDLFNGSAGRGCIFCEKPHPSSECYQARKMSTEEKETKIREKSACFRCLVPGHRSSKCRSKISCLICGKRHHAVMCSEAKPATDGGAKKKRETKEDYTSSQLAVPQQEPKGGDFSMANQTSGGSFLQTLIVRIRGPNGVGQARALIDSGSERSYISEKAASMLGLKPQGKCVLTHNLFGGTSIRQQNHKLYEIEVGGLNGEFPAKLEVLDQPKICGHVRRISKGPWLDELAQNKIEISDVGDECRDIQLLIGADYAAHLTTGNMYVTASGPVGVETNLGWTLMGKCPSTRPGGDSSLVVTSMAVSSVDVQDLWRLDLIGIREDSDSQSRKDLEESAVQHFLATVKINQENRYEVGIPWIEGHPPVPVNRDVAEKRLLSMTKKLEQAKMLKEYNNIFEEWLEAGIIEEVEDSRENCSYLPHRAVIKPESSTTPVRPVFDASAKEKDSASLNQCLEKGPNLIETLPRLLTRFRMGKYGVISDIRKAFLQISVREEDREFLRFLWWDKEKKNLRVFRHTRVVFGITSSPFLLAVTINHHLERMSKLEESCGTSSGDGLSIDESCGLGLGAAKVCEILRGSFYLDNCVTSFETEEEVDQFVKKGTRIMAAGMFDLRGWVWNTGKETSAAEEVPVLGLSWDTAIDGLSLDLRSYLKAEDGPVTKRKILSVAHRIFDPLGFACAVTLIPRKLVQDTFRSKQAWDKPVPEEIKTQFERWCAHVPKLKEMRVERNLLAGSPGDISLHVFADASSIAYAACVFLRKSTPEGVYVKLVMARNRLNTIKKITIPRLELMACYIAARLGDEVKSYLDLGDVRISYWTDSSNALYWIRKNENWAQFVWNRVAEIRKRTNIADWHHISGEVNPADLPSRGCHANTFISSRWWEGPAFMRLPEAEWPKSKVEVSLEVVENEKRKTVASCVASGARASSSTFEEENLGETFPQILRKFVREPAKRQSSEVLSSEDWEEALFLSIQDEMFQKGDVILRQLCAFQDDKGIWRVKTRIVARDDLFEFLNPILLSAAHPVVKSLVRHQHETLHHCGIGTLLTTLRERFWIVHARRLARKVVHSCIRCRRFEAKRLNPVEAPLPLNRVRDAAVFEVTGMDLGGPLYLEGGEKAYFVVFTCAVYRAVHLELVLSLSSEALMGAMERFIARRICPSVLYSDNGTNFVGVHNEFSRKGVKIEWIFSVVAAPWWGGFWESIVGLVKKLLVRLLQKETVNQEDMSTLLAKCEATINSRPLTHLSDDPNDLAPLTPASFLREQKLEGKPEVPQWNQLDFGKQFNRRQKLVTLFKKRFRDEYLSRLVHHVKKQQHRTLKVGELVMVELENKKRIQWPLARVLQLYPGRDGVVRAARLKTETGEITRALQRIFPLEVDTGDDKSQEQEEGEAAPQKAIFTRFGRESKKPKIFNV